MSDYHFSYVPPAVARQAERKTEDVQSAAPTTIAKALPAIEAPIWGPSFSDVKAWFQKMLTPGTKVLPPSEASGGFNLRPPRPVEKP
jgi:hypothetical protein